MRTWAIVVAGGDGARFGSAKQFEVVSGVRLVDHAVASASGVCDAVVLVLPRDVEWDGVRVDATVAGGRTRSESVRAGLGAVPDHADVIVVHDAVRPLAPEHLFTAVITAVREGADGAVPAVPIVDTIKRVDGRRVAETVARDDLVAVQTPQAFRAAALRGAHAPGVDDTDDAALVEKRGGTVVVVPGDPRNVKVTTRTDLSVVATLLASVRSSGSGST